MGSRAKSKRLQFLQPEELDAVIRATPDDRLGAVERPLYLCAAMTGIRQGELLAARWIDIDWTARRVRVADNFTRGQFGTPKSDQGRSIPMADRLAAELDRHFQRSQFQDDNALVFCHPEAGNVLDPSKLRKRFATALTRAQVHQIKFPRAAPHLRHADGGGWRATARDPGVDGPRRREDDRDLRALRPRPQQARQRSLSGRSAPGKGRGKAEISPATLASLCRRPVRRRRGADAIPLRRKESRAVSASTLLLVVEAVA